MLDFVKMSAGLLSLRDMAFNFWTKINLTELVRGKSQVVHHEVIIHVSLQIMVNAFELLLKFLVDLIKLVILVLKNALDRLFICIDEEIDIFFRKIQSVFILNRDIRQDRHKHISDRERLTHFEIEHMFDK